MGEMFGQVCRAAGAAVLALALCAQPGCSSEKGEEDLPAQTTFGPLDRPVELRVPSSYDPDVPMPLIMLLHGHGVNGNAQFGYSRLSGVDALILAPDGTVNEEGDRFWNATDVCCDFYGSGVDDVAYLGGLMDEVRAVYNVDPQRIYFWGHSNGAFMAYRMACERAAEVAAVVSLAGATYADSADCNPSEPVSVLQVHGSADDTVLWEGGGALLEYQATYPGVEGTLGHWAAYNGCAETRSDDAAALNLDSSLDGEETSVSRHDDCPAGIDVELWAIAGGEHIPSLTPRAGPLFWDWMQAHPKP